MTSVDGDTFCPERESDSIQMGQDLSKHLHGLFNINPKGIYGINDFDLLNDSEFIYVAYMVLLRRPPDPEGERYYLSRIRQGISKEHLLIQMMKSGEAKEARTHIRWIKAYAFLEGILNIPIFGSAIALLLFSLTIKDHLKALRAIENRIYRIMRTIDSDHSK